MKLIKLFLLLAFAGCAGQPETKAGHFPDYLDQKGYKKAIVISCIRCNCVLEQMNKIIKEQPDLLSNYVILGDTACLHNFAGRKRVLQMRQMQMDSLSEDFYNILVYNNGKIRMIKTEESGKMDSYLK